MARSIAASVFTFFPSHRSCLGQGRPTLICPNPLLLQKCRAKSKSLSVAGCCSSEYPHHYRMLEETKVELSHDFHGVWFPLQRQRRTSSMGCSTNGNSLTAQRSPRVGGLRAVSPSPGLTKRATTELCHRTQRPWSCGTQRGVNQSRERRAHVGTPVANQLARSHLARPGLDVVVRGTCVDNFHAFFMLSGLQERNDVG